MLGMHLGRNKKGKKTTWDYTGPGIKKPHYTSALAHVVGFLVVNG